MPIWRATYARDSRRRLCTNATLDSVRSSRASCPVLLSRGICPRIPSTYSSEKRREQWITVECAATDFRPRVAFDTTSRHIGSIGPIPVASIAPQSDPTVEVESRGGRKRARKEREDGERRRVDSSHARESVIDGNVSSTYPDTLLGNTNRMLIAAFDEKLTSQRANCAAIPAGPL